MRLGVDVEVIVRYCQQSGMLSLSVGCASASNHWMFHVTPMVPDTANRKVVASRLERVLSKPEPWEVPFYVPALLDLSASRCRNIQLPETDRRYFVSEFLPKIGNDFCFRPSCGVAVPLLDRLINWDP